ncbi:MAG: hypothetical protein VYA34_11810 [Myxococcota bacterium]|nr:hypothetical protein [Myxococcota bacterium]
MSRWPKVDIVEVGTAMGIDLASAFRQLQSIYDDVDSRNAKNTVGLNLPCHRGCGDCCYESVFLTPLEFFYVWDWVQKNIEDERRTEMVDDGLAIYQANKETIDALSSNRPRAQAAHDELALSLKFKCPLLAVDGACEVYPVRELLGRLFGCSFNNDSGVYGCHLVGAHLAGKTVTLLPAEATASRLQSLPLTARRNVYPYYINKLYGSYVA